MRMLALAGAIVALGVSGCGPRSSIADQCSGFGWRPGTEGHANCQMQMRIADQNYQRMSGDALINMGAQMMMQPPRQSAPEPGGMTTYTMPNGQTMTCSRLGGMVNCF